MIDEEIDFMDAEMLRKKAEDELKRKQRISGITILETDIKKLLHELQVHQIELEMQNEELQNAYETAETSLKKYTMLYDFAPVGFLTLDTDGSICDLNFTAAEMLGEKRISLINSNFKLFVSDESKPAFNDFFKKVYSSHAREICEVNLGYDNKPLCHAYLEGIVTGVDNRCLLTVLDISGFKKSE